MNPKKINDSFVLSRKLVMPDQINPNGTLFGGVLMSWIDKVAYMSAQKHSGRTFVVTASIDSIQFDAPLKVGDQVVLSAKVVFVGTTSMEIRVLIEREDPTTALRTSSGSAWLTFVALTPDAKPSPVPKLQIESLEEASLYAQARIRVAVRKRLQRFFMSRFRRSFTAPAISGSTSTPESDVYLKVPLIKP